MPHWASSSPAAKQTSLWRRPRSWIWAGTHSSSTPPNTWDSAENMSDTSYTTCPTMTPIKSSSSGGSYDTVCYMMERGISFNHLLWGVNTDECMCEGGAVCDARPDDGTPLIKLCGSEVGRGPGCRHIVMSADCKGGSADCDQGEGGSGSGWDGCKGQPK